MKSIGYTCADGHWTRDRKPVARFTWREFAKWALELLTVAVVAFALAFFFVEALGRDEFVQQAKQAKRYEDLDSQVRPLPTWGADGPAYSSGHQYYRNKAERNR